MSAVRRFSWEISDDGRRVSLWDDTKAMMTRFRFKKNKKLARVCAECAFAVEKTVCNNVSCDGGFFVSYDCNPKSLRNPSDLADGHRFQFSRSEVPNV